MSRPTGDSPPRMRGATASVAGSRGIVPKPTAGQHTFMLLGDGTWGAQPIAGLPSQTSNSGKLLTTDGTNASWTTTGVLTSLTSPASTNLTLGTTSFGTALTAVSSNGQVGIGTTTPSDRFVVSNAGAAGLEFGVTTSVINQAYNRSTSNYVDYQDNCLNRIFCTGGTIAALTLSSTQAATFAGAATISSTDAGSSGAGALVVQGGISAGQSAQGSYFGGTVTVGKGIVVTDVASSGLTLAMSHATVPAIRFNKTASTAQTWQLNGSGSAFALENVTGSTVPFQISTTGAATFAGTVIAPAATASLAPLRIPHGTAPTSPTDGDMWTTTAGLYIRINGATVGPLS